MKTPINNIFYGVIVGAFSGLLSTGLTILLFPGGVFLAGAVFGGITLVHFKDDFKKEAIIRSIGWITFSTFSHLVASWITLQGLCPFICGMYMLGGFVGSIILVFWFHLLIRKLSIKQIVSAVILGSVVSVTGLFKLDMSTAWINFLVLFVLWQAGMMAIFSASKNKPISR